MSLKDRILNWLLKRYGHRYGWYHTSVDYKMGRSVEFYNDHCGCTMKLTHRRDCPAKKTKPSRKT